MANRNLVDSDTMCAKIGNFNHGGHGVSRREKGFSYQNYLRFLAVFLCVLRGYILTKLPPVLALTMSADIKRG